jgi:hypothetical protein
VNRAAVPQPGDILVFNFNNAANQQGTGHTIVRVQVQWTTQRVRSEIVEFTVTGKFVNEFSIDDNIDGPFGIAIENLGHTKPVRLSQRQQEHPHGFEARLFK